MLWTYKRYMYNVYKVLPSSAYPSCSVNLLKLLAAEFSEGAKTSCLEYKVEEFDSVLSSHTREKPSRTDLILPVQLHINVEQLRNDQIIGSLSISFHF